MADNTINQRPACGPLYIPKTPGKSIPRDKQLNSLRDNANLTDQVYPDKCRVKSMPASYRDDTLASKPSNVEIVDHYKKMIKMHIERRIESFLLQCAITHNTLFYYEEGPTRTQGESPDSLKLKIGKKITPIVARHAAHSSTIPCLIAYDAIGYQKFTAGKKSKPKGAIFLAYTDYDRIQGRTENMPSWINLADREIDEMRTDSHLRKKP